MTTETLTSLTIMWMNQANGTTGILGITAHIVIGAN